MKKIFYLITTFAISMFVFFNSKDLTTYAATTYHLASENSVKSEYNITLQSGYYIFFSANVELKDPMFLGDVTGYNSSNNHQFIFSQHIDVAEEDVTKVNEMVEEFMNYYEVSKLPDYGSIYLAKVESFGVFDPNAEDAIDILEIFYAANAAPTTDATIAGSKAHIMTIDSLIPIETIKSRYTATDIVDGEITDRLEFITDYGVEGEKITPRNYYILVSVTDNAGNITYAADSILVRDLAAPTVTLENNEVTRYIGQTFTSSEAKKLFTFKDNYSPNDRLAIVFEDEYQSKYDRIGVYKISAYCMDESGNFSDIAVLTIRIEDNEAPEVFLKSGGNRIIADHELSNEEILNLFTPVDNYYSEGEIEMIISFNSCDGRQGVDFQLCIKVIDGSENEMTYDFIYYITDTEAPIIYVTDTIYLEYGKELSNEEFIRLLQELGIATDDIVDVSIIDEITEGDISTITYLVTSSSGETLTGVIDINYFATTEIVKTENNTLFLILISATTLILIGCGVLVIYKKKH